MQRASHCALVTVTPSLLRERRRSPRTPKTSAPGHARTELIADARRLSQGIGQRREKEENGFEGAAEKWPRAVLREASESLVELRDSARMAFPENIPSLLPRATSAENEPFSILKTAMRKQTEPLPQPAFLPQQARWRLSGLRPSPSRCSLEELISSLPMAPTWLRVPLFTRILTSESKLPPRALTSMCRFLNSLAVPRRL